MLIDIFARRYASVELRDTFEPRDRALLVQAFRILAEDMYPYYVAGKEDSTGVSFWTNLHSRLSRELGLQQLSPEWFTHTTTWNGNETRQQIKFSLVKVCENWMLAPVTTSPDQHMKERLSLIELGFRQREAEINAMNAAPISVPSRPAPMIGGGSANRPPARDFAKEIGQHRATKTAAYRASVDELNARFRQAGYSLHYHNGFIQASTDEVVQTNVETPFWSLVAHPRWANVDTDMKEALDLRDSDGRDPAFYAARALESAIKIICKDKGWNTGKERGAHNYIERLAAKEHGFITPWEADNLKSFFTSVRNPFGHGPGHEKMPSLTRPQTEWAIEYSMSWIKSLIRRL